MLVKTALAALLGLAVAAEASTIHRTPTLDRLSRRQNRGGKTGGTGGAGGANGGAANGAATGTGTGTGGNNAAANAGSPTCLQANAIQTGSQSTGQNSAVAADGQVNSKTDPANFINVCAGKKLTNGLQDRAGSCNGIPMGDIPATSKMVSTVIINPKNLDVLPEKQTFDIQVIVANMALGSFTNATSTYYSAPQALDGQGRIIGHTHVTVQDLGSTLNPTQPLDGEKFVFFKGINDAGNGQGLLKATVTGGLPASNYRVCSMAGASNHQPVLMAVAQRGAQDDCKYFTVSAGGGGAANATGAGAGAGAAGAATGGAKAGAGTNNAAGKGGAAGSAASSSAAAASTSAAAAGGNGGGRGGGGRGGAGGAGAGAATSSAAAASTSAAASANAGGRGGGRGGFGGGAGGGAGAGQASAATSAAAAASTSAAASAGKGGKAGTANNAAASSGAAAGGAIGGIAAPPVQDSGDKTRPFEVNGDTFVNKAAAVQRSCAVQNTQCSNAVNSGKIPGTTVTDCNNQEEACNAAAGA